MLKYLNPWYWLVQRSVERKAEEKRIADDEREAEEIRQKYYTEQVRTLDEMKMKRVARMQAETGLTAQNAVRTSTQAKEVPPKPRPGYVNDYTSSSDTDALMMFQSSDSSSYTPSSSSSCDSNSISSSSSSDSSSSSSSCDSGSSSSSDSGSW